MAIGDMSITYDRMNVVDFTMPFMNLGISILYKTPAKTPPGLFSFLDPFHLDVWIYMATAYLGVSLILFILARYALSPALALFLIQSNLSKFETGTTVTYLQPTPTTYIYF